MSWAPSAPLSGLRVAELASAFTAYAGKLLLDLGANVTIITLPEQSLDTDPELESPDIREAHLSLGKSRLDGVDQLRMLLTQSDVLLTSLSPDDLHSLQLSYEELLDESPNLTIVSITAFGLSGPLRYWRGSDLIAWASSGYLHSFDASDRPPVIPGGDLALSIAGQNAAAAALLARLNSGSTKTRFVDVSVQDCLISIGSEVGLPVWLDSPMQRIQIRGGAGSGSITTKDGAEVTLRIAMPDHWVALSGWIAEKTHHDEATSSAFLGSNASRAQFRELIDGWVAELAGLYERDAFVREGQRRGLPVTPVNSPADLLEDEHLRVTDAWLRVSHPLLGDYSSLRAPFRFED